jgi:AmmeMemoRadiSam system protein A
MTALTLDERRTLLVLARASLEQRLLHEGALDRELARATLTAALEEPRGAFVTLKRLRVESERALRGCVGCLEARRPLHRSVIEMAAEAGLEDRRFSPLTAAELPEVTIEISALGPLRPVRTAGEIDVTRHGVRLVREKRSAVFLPQVAREHGWDVETLLAQLARKAGLGEGGWHEAALAVFDAEIFAEVGG